MALPRISILALLLLIAIAAVSADDKAAPAGDKAALAPARDKAAPAGGKAAPAGDKAAPAGDKAAAAPAGSDLPAVLTPFAQSPGMADSLADAPSNAIDDSDVNSDAALGSPAKAEDYGARDSDASSPSSAAATSAAAAVSVAAAAAGAGYMFF